ncbi:site-specific integrase [Peribacillus sp. NJ4]|uniref:site-specific integrase n=1 Tax=Peribacillus sp. NJ4 TaxID=3055862 RepID=UPI0025A2F495|nr:site-specific integrase [Peribacillus sp. NJ4]MDM5214636.1 site-specific integrase [Peribacillus sp. NJ4]
MANTRQHQVHEQKLEQLVKSIPFYIVEYVDNKLDIRSSSTLLNYILDYKLFLEWLIAEGIAEQEHIKDIPLSVLEKLKLIEAQSFIKFLERRNIPINKKETKKAEKVSVNRKISALRSFFKYLTTQTENDDGEPYFYRNVMLKIEVNKVKETLGARASRISTKIFHNNEDARFLEFVKHDYEKELPEKSRKLIYFIFYKAMNTLNSIYKYQLSYRLASKTLNVLANRELNLFRSWFLHSPLSNR